MSLDINQIVIAIVAIFTPFAPFLIEVSKAGGKKLAEVIAEKGGETAWNKAQILWSKLKTHFDNDSEVQSAATMVAANPEDKNRQAILAEVLRLRLEENPTLGQELFKLLGGKEGIQQVLAERASWVEDITQHMKNGGKQIVKASDESVIRGVRQVKE
jgi:hypothetical protein